MSLSRFWSTGCSPILSIFRQRASSLPWLRAIYAAIGLWYGASYLIAEWHYSTGLQLVSTDYDLAWRRLESARTLFPFDWRYQLGPVQAAAISQRTGAQVLAEARRVRLANPYLPGLRNYEAALILQETLFNPVTVAGSKT